MMNWRHNFWIIAKRGFFVTGAVLIILGFFAAVFYARYKPADKTIFGVSFSLTHAEYTGLPWKEVYSAMLAELKPRKIRLMAYWEIIEPQQGVFDFSKIDWMLEQARLHKTTVTLVVGHKQPRWPECHHPDWWNALSDEQKIDAQLKMVETAVNHFKQFSVIETWQVENEPLFNFGPNCPKMSRDVLKKEIALVKGLDGRLIITTDSGELGRWLPTATVGADLFGSTMYRVVHNPRIGHFSYPIGPWFFKIKGGMLQMLTRHKTIVGAELQAEPWFATDMWQTPLQEQYELMNPDILHSNVAFARETGFAEHYLWGVEWWYWLKEKHNDPTMWDAAKNILE